MTTFETVIVIYLTIFAIAMIVGMVVAIKKMGEDK
jgi:hypothetical protein